MFIRAESTSFLEVVESGLGPSAHSMSIVTSCSPGAQRRNLRGSAQQISTYSLATSRPTMSLFLATTFQCLKHGFKPEAPFQSKAARRPSPSENKSVNLPNNITIWPSPVGIATPTVCKPWVPRRSNSKNVSSMWAQPPRTLSMTLCRTTTGVNHTASEERFSHPNSLKLKDNTMHFLWLLTFSLLPGLNSSNPTTMDHGASLVQGFSRRMRTKRSRKGCRSASSLLKSKPGSAMSHDHSGPSTIASKILALTSSNRSWKPSASCRRCTVSSSGLFRRRLKSSSKPLLLIFPSRVRPRKESRASPEMRGCLLGRSIANGRNSDNTLKRHGR